MARSENQKLKLITLREILLEKTDEEHPMNTQKLIDELAKRGISAERKSIYQDIEALEDVGLDIMKISGRSNEYYVADREFELPELKMLVDVVQAAKFITEKKSRQLIEKLEKQTSQYAAKQLSRDVVVANRSKTTNENIFYNVDVIHHAIAQDKQISFCYYEWNVKKEFVPRKNGELYHISPWALIWDDENYYLLGYDPEAKLMKHYRVDKMKNIDESDKKREGRKEMESFDMAAFCKSTFGMFAGEETMISVTGQESMVGILIDRFGKDIMIRPLEGDRFEARIPVKVSPQFFGWLAALDNKIQIASPDWVRQQYKDYLTNLLKQL
ncbi:MAG: helix-turn-helix transcriptional regulator [Lachnospiraceae bacterium]